MTQNLTRWLAFASGAVLLGLVVLFQKEPTIENETPPLAHWIFDKVDEKQQITDRCEKFPLTLRGVGKFLREPKCLELKGNESLLVHPKQKGDDPNLPREGITISALVRLDKGEQYGGIIGCMQDNGDFERGWLLGYDEKRFVFNLCGDKTPSRKLTSLASKTAFQRGVWYHVLATYDGNTMKLFVNGKQENSSAEQTGAISYAPHAPFVVGRYRDDNEDYPMSGALSEIQLYPRALSAETVQKLFETQKKLTELPATPVPPSFVVEPYLQFPTLESIVIMWETSLPANSTVMFGATDRTLAPITVEEKVTLHEVPLKNLKPNTKYVYKVSSVDAEGKTIESELRQFMTAVDAESAYSFGVIGDTQKNPKVTGQVAKLIFDRRPNFVIHCGDVVDNGPDKKEWEDELFRPCQALFSRVPVFPCIGNHEKNHAHYYKYFSLPDPEYYYRYTYGNAEFFVLDSNKGLKPGSEQYRWLDKVLGESKAKWKFAYHHHPVWSSDENDYGDSWKGVSRMGDLNARSLMELYEKHNLDICFNGHIHLYERSWPVREGKVNREKGVIYITSGGGGGGLENFAPLPNWFKAQCRVDFHFCLVNIHGNRFEMKVFDQQGNFFDFLDLTK